MAFVPCKTCGERIADNAEACPHCGHSYKGLDLEKITCGFPNLLLLAVCVILVVLLVIACIFAFYV